MQIHQLSRTHTNRKSVRVARGGKRGKTSGRGTKGQKARSGHRIRPEIRDLIKKLPKRRGYGTNRSRTVNPNVVRPKVVNLDTVSELFKDGDQVNPTVLLKTGIISRQTGRIPVVKILGRGTLTKKVTFSGVTVSKEAREKIVKVGGTIL